MNLSIAPKLCGAPETPVTLFHQLIALCAHMPAYPLEPAERRHLGGLIVPMTPALVTFTATALCDHPERFADSPVTGPQLHERQSCANHWRMLRNCFQLLMERANDHYLLTQGQAAHDAMAVLRSTSALPRTDPARAPRTLALIGAYALVDSYQKRIQKRQAARKKAAGEPPKPRRRQLRGDARRAALLRFQALILEVFAIYLRQRPKPPNPGVYELHAEGKNFTPPSQPPSEPLKNCLDPDPKVGYKPPCSTKEGPMSREEELVDLFEKKNGILQPPRPEDSFMHSVDELHKGRDQARATARNFPTLDLPEDNAQQFAAQRFPAVGSVCALMGQGIANHPGLLTGVVGDPALWSHVGELDRATGRLIWCGQLFYGGGEAGELTVTAAARGVCEGALKQAEALINAPATPADHKVALRAACTEAFRLQADQRAREQQPQKTLEDKTQPLKDRVTQTQEAAATSRAIEGYLASRGGTP